MARVEKWRNLGQPSYDLTGAIAHLVADLAGRLGMSGATAKALMNKPRSFVESLTAADTQGLSARPASIHRLPARWPSAVDVG